MPPYSAHRVTDKKKAHEKLPETGKGHGIARYGTAIKMNPGSFAMILLSER
jgi:hypothetical protein